MIAASVDRRKLHHNIIKAIDLMGEATYLDLLHGVPGVRRASLSEALDTLQESGDVLRDTSRGKAIYTSAQGALERVQTSLDGVAAPRRLTNASSFDYGHVKEASMRCVRAGGEDFLKYVGAAP